MEKRFRFEAKGIVLGKYWGGGSGAYPTINLQSETHEELIEKINMDNGILKAIYMKNGCKIQFVTYDQGSENLQG